MSNRIIFLLLLSALFLIAGTNQYMETGDPSDVNNVVFIPEYGSSGDMRNDELYLFTGKVKYVLADAIIEMDEIRYNFGNADSNQTSVWHEPSPNEKYITVNYPALDFGDSLIVDIWLEGRSYEIEYDDWFDINYTGKVILYQSPNYRYGTSDDYLIGLYSSDDVLDKPMLIVEGFDPMNETQLGGIFHLLSRFYYNDLAPEGYDLFIMNFENGGAIMQDNAMKVLDALDAIYDLMPNKEIKIALTGISMGGVVSRYALAYAEENNIDHHTGIFLSYDSPQQGAVFNYGFQQWIASQTSNNTIKSFQDRLKTNAAKQLLKGNVYATNEHDLFYNELNALNGDGYPHLCKNVAISNGTFESANNIYSTSSLFNFYLNGQLSYSADLETYDYYPGSLMAIKGFSQSGSNTLYTLPTFAQLLGFQSIKIDWDIEIIENPVFIETESALDLQGAVPIAGQGFYTIGQSKFDDYVIQNETNVHEAITEKTKDKIMYWLTSDTIAVKTSNVYKGENIENSTLSVDDLVSSVYSGNKVFLSSNTNI